MTRAGDWRFVCPLDAIVAETGVGVDLDGRQLAVFHVEGAVYALDNLDPACGANVLSRGIVGEMDGERVVASPMYKHHYSLITGRCLDDATLSVAYQAYSQFSFGNYAYTAAMAFILFIAIGILTFVQFRLFRPET